MLSTLDIHVIGGAIGESIVIRFPQGEWAVVDAFASKVDDPQTNPTYQFLLERRVERLEWVCASHPHDDHIRGIRQLLEKWPVDRVIVPDIGLSLQEMRDFADRLWTFYKQQQSPEEANSVNEMVKLAGTIRELRDRGRGQIRIEAVRVGELEEFWPKAAESLSDERGAPIHIRAMAPGPNQLDNYHEDVIRERGETPDRLYADANGVSVVLMIEYLSARVILCGDADIKEWTEVMKMGRSAPVANLVKISHHGSKTGVNREIWKFVAAPDNIAVLCPFRRHKLPRQAQIDFYSNNSPELHATIPIDDNEDGPASVIRLSNEAAILVGAGFAEVAKDGGDEGICSFHVHSNGLVTPFEI